MIELTRDNALPDCESGSDPHSEGMRDRIDYTADPAEMENDMADRTWNQVDARIYSDMDCSEEAVIIWAYLLAVCPNQYGVYDLPLPAMRRFFGRLIPAEKLSECLDELIAYGCMSLYHERKIIWIHKKFKRERKASATRDQRKGALAFIGEHFPMVLSDFASLYPVIGESRGSDTPVIPQSTESDSEADTESKKKKTIPRKAALPLPSLADLEKEIDPHWLPEWKAWLSVFIGQNKTGQMMESRIVRTLQHVLEVIEREQLSVPAICFGFSEAIRREVPNENYVMKAAKGWKPPDPTAGMSNDEYYGTAAKPLSPDELAAEEAAYQQRERTRLADLCIRAGVEIETGPVDMETEDYVLFASGTRVNKRPAVEAEHG